MGRLSLAAPLLLLLAPVFAGCSKSGEDDGTSDLAMVTSLSCSVARASFVPKSSASASGDLAITCPGVRGVLFNGASVPGDNLTSFSVKPIDGINILHVEQGDGDTAMATDIPFMFGTFKEASSFIPDAIAFRANAAGLSNGPVVLPLPAGKSAVTLSQIGTQILRDKGNILGRLDGVGKDVSGFGFEAGVHIIHAAYDPSNLVVSVSPRAGGVHVETTIHGAEASLGWDAGVTFFQFSDQIGAAADSINVSADIDLRYDRGSQKIVASLAGHQVGVQGVALDSADLDKIPFIAAGVEAALSAGAEALVNTFADPLLNFVQDTLAPAIAVSIEQLKLPSQITIPVVGGTVGIGENIDGAAFDANGLQLSLAARVTAPTPNTIPAPGFLSHPSGQPTLDQNAALSASVAVDYVNQALYAAWKQNVLNRQVSGPLSVFGVSTDAIFSDAKMPPVAFPTADGQGVMLHLGELELTTTFHSSSAGDAKVRVAVTVTAGANVTLDTDAQTLVLKATHDEIHTHLVTELLAVEDGKQGAADELREILAQFTPVLESTIADDFAIPPIPIPAIDLGMVTPGLAGHKAGFDGALKFDPKTNRIGIDGKLLAN